MKLSGHRTRSVFDRYNVVSEADLQDAAAKLNAAHPDSSVTWARKTLRREREQVSFPNCPFG